MDDFQEKNVGNAKRTYKVEDIASILNVSKSSAYELVKQGHFNIVKIGSAIRISKKSFDHWLDSNPAERR